MNLSNGTSYRLLAADDDVDILDDYSWVLGSPVVGPSKLLSGVEGGLGAAGNGEDPFPHIELDTKENGREAIDAVSEAVMTGRPYAVAFIDVRMPPGINGIDAAAQIRAVDPNVEIVFVTGFSDFNSVLEGLKFPPVGKVYFVEKPFDVEEFRDLTMALCRKWAGEETFTPRELEVLANRAVAERTVDFDPVKEFLAQLKSDKAEQDASV